MANSWRAKMEAMRAESARNHEDIIDLLNEYAILIGRTKEVEEWENEAGGNLEELILTSAVDKGDFMGPILAVKEDLQKNLIDDLDEPLMVLKSHGMINKNEFAVVAPAVAAVAPFVVAPIAVAPVVVAHVEPSFVPLGRKIKQNQAEQKLGSEICL
uniref:Associate of Myc 1 n=1 Tax=Tanacetum cinerariifolium TaxID=118510 RepID=A0A699KAB0_TANCI|nr:associate of Myc 1 [Tanacetum cinerariifolium]